MNFFITWVRAITLFAIITFPYFNSLGETPDPENCIIQLKNQTPSSQDPRLSQLEDLLNDSNSANNSGSANAKFLQNQLQRIFDLLQPLATSNITETELTKIENLLSAPSIISHPHSALFFGELAVAGMSHFNRLPPAKKSSVYTGIQRQILQRIFLAAFTQTISFIEAGPQHSVDPSSEFKEPYLFITLKLLNREKLSRLFQTPDDPNPWILKKVDDDWRTQLDSGSQIPGRIELAAIFSLDSWGPLTQNALLNVVESLQPELLIPETKAGAKTLRPSTPLLKRRKFIAENPDLLMKALSIWLSQERGAGSEWSPISLESELRHWQFDQAGALTSEDLKFILNTLNRTSTQNGTPMKADLAASLWIHSYKLWKQSLQEKNNTNEPFLIFMPENAVPQVSALLKKKFEHALIAATDTLKLIYEREDETYLRQSLPASPRYESLALQLIPFLELAAFTKIEAEAAYSIRNWLTQHLLILKKYEENSREMDDLVEQAKWHKQVQAYKTILDKITEISHTAPMSETMPPPVETPQAFFPDEQDPLN